MDWAGWALFGLVATAALTVIMIAAQLAGLSRLDLPLVLGTLVTEDPDRARVAGFVIHLARPRSRSRMPNGPGGTRRRSEQRRHQLHPGADAEAVDAAQAPPAGMRRTACRPGGAAHPRRRARGCR